MKPKMQPNRRVKAIRKNQTGAIAIMCLAGILITMMMAWVIFDAGPATREKYQLQAAADAAAYSQAAVKARSMNMIVYGNVAKRSIFSIVTLYPAMWAAYISWWYYHASQCFKKWPKWSSCRKFFRNLPQVFKEALNDFDDMKGANWLEAFGYPAWMWFMKPKGNLNDHHFQDMLAIDNYQLYTMGVTPWWAWTEGAVRGIKNGATASTSFPPPNGKFFTAIPQLINKIFAFLGRIGIGSGPLYNSSGKTDRFPLVRARRYRDMMFSPTGVSLIEQGVNVIHHRNRSAKGAKRWSVVAAGALLAPAHWLLADGFLFFNRGKYPEYGKVFEFENYRTLGAYLADTSYISYTYKQNQDRMNKDRDKYGYLKADYNHQLGALDDATYKGGGLWTMSRSEISYQGDGKPSQWIPSWTARLRPIALPNEFAEAGYDLNATYHDILPYLAVLSVVGGRFSGSSIIGSIQDLVLLERTTRGMGQSTIRGVGK